MSSTEKIPGIRYCAKVPDKQNIASMIDFRGQLIVATEEGRLYRMAPRRKGHYKMVPIYFQKAL